MLLRPAILKKHFMKRRGRNFGNAALSDPLAERVAFSGETLFTSRESPAKNQKPRVIKNV